MIYNNDIGLVLCNSDSFANIAQITIDDIVIDVSNHNKCVICGSKIGANGMLIAHKQQSWYFCNECSKTFVERLQMLNYKQNKVVPDDIFELDA